MINIVLPRNEIRIGQGRQKYLTYVGLPTTCYTYIIIYRFRNYTIVGVQKLPNETLTIFRNN